jgi:hypothetical protein
MRRCRSGLLLILAMTVLSAPRAHGWGANTHQQMARNVLDTPTISPYLPLLGLDASTISGMAWELDLPAYRDTYHLPAWETLRDELWLTDPKWADLNETRRVAFLCHLACDCGVPVGNDPAGEVWSNGTVEALLENRINLWTALPDIVPYAGTYDEKISAFYSQEMPFVDWARAHLRWYNVGRGEGETAGNEGVALGQNLCQAVLGQYFYIRSGGVVFNPPVITVPEPSTWTLLFMVGALLLWNWCRKIRRPAH